VDEVHIKTEEILAYVAGKLRDKEAFMVETHLATCAECAKRVNAHYLIRDHFDELWETWTAKRHVEELIKARIYKASEENDIRPELQERLKAWLARFPNRIEAALNVVIDTTKCTAEIIQEGLEALRPPGGLPAFSPVPAPMRILGEEETQPASIVVESKEPPWKKVIVDPVIRQITVLIEIQESPWPILMLTPKGDGELLVAELRHPEGTDYLLAEFEDVPGGEFILILVDTSPDEKTES
jgi:hypothetical protein